MSESNIPSGWLRGVLDPCLLALLAGGEAYGYELARRLDEAGIGRVPGGSLYPALLRLEQQGLLEATWRAGEGGPGRKYYRLTEDGAEALGQQSDQWAAFASSVSRLLGSEARA
jgi:PadR family transcriptional regulator PadR